MSIRLMTAVFDRYPNGGGEMLLALSLADFADDDGSRVFPSIKQLAEKTRQSERTVQYQLRRMEDMGWLILINNGNGGRNQRREYVISPEWIKGADIAPIEKGATDDIKGASDDTKGCNPQHERVQPVAPAYNHHRTIKEPSVNHQRVNASVDEEFELAWSAYPKRAGGNSKVAARKAWQARLKTGIEPGDMVAGVQRYAAYCQATERTGTQFVQQAATFFGPDLHFENDFEIPSRDAGRKSTADRNADWNEKMRQAMRSTQPIHQPMKDMGTIDASR